MVAAEAVRTVLLAHDSHLLREIASFLPSVVDVNNLFCLSKSICFCSVKEKDARVAMLRLTLLRNLTRMLVPFGVSALEFVAALRADGASVSGGFALACVTGNNSRFGDIDVFRHAEFLPRSATPALFLNIGYSLCNGNDNYPYSYGYAEVIGGNDVKLIVRTLEHIEFNQSIQFITLIYRDEHLPSPYSEITATSRHLANFDLTPCCVNLSVSRESGNLQWHISFLHDISAGVLGPTPRLHAMASVQPNSITCSTLRRIMKYARRGFCPTVELEVVILSACTPDVVDYVRGIFEKAKQLSRCLPSFYVE